MKKHGLATLDEVMLIAILIREGEFATSDAAYTAWLMPSIRKIVKCVQDEGKQWWTNKY